MALPGINTVIRDRFYTLSRTEIPVGPRIVAIGRRHDDTDTTVTRGDEVPDLDPYNASNEKDVIEVFGAQSDLHRAYLELVSGGATRITLVALPSDTVFDHAAGTVTSDNYAAALDSTFDPLTDPPADVFDAAFAAAEAVRADIIVPWGRGAHPDDDGDYDPLTSPEIGFYANNLSSANSWAVKVARKCAEITLNSYPCFAVMGIAPFLGAAYAGADGAMTAAQVSSHLNVGTTGDFPLISRNDVLMAGDGIYLSVVATELKPLGYERNYEWGYANGAATYAGHLAQLAEWSAPTGKVVFNIERARYNPTRTQTEHLIEKGLVPVGLNFNRVPTWIDGQTFGKETSDYVRLTTLRIIFASVQMIRQVAQQFIGEATTIHARNSLETAITGGLRGMQQQGALLASDFAVSYIPTENKAIIDLILTPAFELRTLEIRVAVQL